MEIYDISKVDIFSIPLSKRGELANLHSVLLFLYSKFHGSSEISLRYSEFQWLNYNTVYKTIIKLHELNLVTLIETPTKQKPLVVRLKPNRELHYILNKDKKVCFEIYNNINFNSKNFREAIGCHHLNEHFIETSVNSWLRNVQNKTWDLYKFLTITKIVSYFSTDVKVKTFSVNKYASNKTIFTKNVSFLYEKIPDNRKEIIYNEFLNALKSRDLTSDQSFVGIVSTYLNAIK
jgi:hypothetical protein